MIFVNPVAKCWPLKFLCNYIHLTSDWFCVNVHKQLGYFRKEHLKDEREEISE